MVPVSSIWIGDRLSLMERLCVQSYLNHGHPFRLYTYGRVEGIPAGVEVIDAATILPPSRIFRSSNGAVGDFANLFKYYVLADFGGIWTEMDEVCLRPWTEVLGMFISSEDDICGGAHIDQAAICITPEHPMMTSLVESCEARLSQSGEFKWGTFGTPHFAAAVKAHGLEERVLPPGVFCPLPWWKAADLMKPGEVPAAAYGIQLWNEAWRREGWDKDMAPPGSLYAQLCNLVGI